MTGTTGAQNEIGAPFLSYAGGDTHEVFLHGDRVQVRTREGGAWSEWQLEAPPERRLQLGLLKGALTGAGAERHALAAMDATFAIHDDRRTLHLAMPERLPELAQRGVLLPDANGMLRACRDTLWQQSDLWMPTQPRAIALQYAITADKRHPVRAPKPQGVLYRRFIPWLGKTFTFRSFDMERDIGSFHRWMNDPDVAHVWEEEGDLDKHRAYINAIERDPHMYSMMASIDDEPFAYFETYWAKESRIAAFYDVQDYDRGWHVLVGEAAMRGRAFATAWLTSISHYLFLCDPRTTRAMGEPRIDHVQQIRNLDKSGYAKVKEFDLPHKRALLVSMLRERYFTDALWLPRDDSAPISGRPRDPAL